MKNKILLTIICLVIVCTLTLSSCADNNTADNKPTTTTTTDKKEEPQEEEINTVLMGQVEEVYTAYAASTTSPLSYTSWIDDIKGANKNKSISALTKTATVGNLDYYALIFSDGSVYEFALINNTSGVATYAAMDQNSHTHGLQYEQVAPTCQEFGYDHYWCEGCDYELLLNMKPKVDHDYIDCLPEKSGCATYYKTICKYCNKYSQDIQSDVSHTWATQWTGEDNPNRHYRYCLICEEIAFQDHAAQINTYFDELYPDAAIYTTGYQIDVACFCGYQYHAYRFSNILGEFIWNMTTSKLYRTQEDKIYDISGITVSVISTGMAVNITKFEQAQIDCLINYRTLVNDNDIQSVTYNETYIKSTTDRV